MVVAPTKYALVVVLENRYLDLHVVVVRDNFAKPLVRHFVGVLDALVGDDIVYCVLLFLPIRFNHRGVERGVEHGCFFNHI